MCSGQTKGDSPQIGLSQTYCLLSTDSTLELPSSVWVEKLVMPTSLKASCSWVQDEVIQRFEDRCTEANAEIQQLQAALQDANKRLETADNRLSSTMESRNKLRKQLEAKHSDTTFMQASLAADNEVLKVTTTNIHCCIANM